MLPCLMIEGASIGAYAIQSPASGMIVMNVFLNLIFNNLSFTFSSLSITQSTGDLQGKLITCALFRSNSYTRAPRDLNFFEVLLLLI